MPTLQEILTQDLAIGATEKVASYGDPALAEMDRIAEELGLDKLAEEGESHEEHEAGESAKKEEEEEKKASFTGIFSEMFPEDEHLSKTAEELEKIAAEENLGARSYEIFEDRFDRRIEKLAAEHLSGGATISAATAPDHDGPVHGDTNPPQQQKNNKPANAHEKIDTTPSYTDEIHRGDDTRVVGHYEQKTAAVKAAALRKHLLLSQLEA